MSRTVRDLEALLGLQLFERWSRGARPTQAGADYVASARDILARVDRAGRNASLAKEGLVGRLSVGFVWSFSSRPVLDLLQSFRGVYPGIAIHTVEDGNEELIARLIADEIDVALTATDPPPYKRLRNIGALSTMPLWLEPLCVVVPQTCDLRCVSWEDLAERRLLCQPKDDWRRFVEYVKQLGGPTLHFTVEDVSREGLVGLVAIGVGWLIVPSSVVQHSLPGSRIIPIVARGAALQVEAVWQQRTARPALSRFLELARETFM